MSCGSTFALTPETLRMLSEKLCRLPQLQCVSPRTYVAGMSSSAPAPSPVTPSPFVYGCENACGALRETGASSYCPACKGYTLTVRQTRRSSQAKATPGVKAAEDFGYIAKRMKELGLDKHVGSSGKTGMDDPRAKAPAPTAGTAPRKRYAEDEEDLL